MYKIRMIFVNELRTCAVTVTSVNKSEMPSATTSAGCSTTEIKRERKVNFNYDELRVILDLFKTNAYQF